MMNRWVAIASLGVVVLSQVEAGCYSAPSGLTTEQGKTLPPGSDGDGASARGGSGLPCEVQALLASRCQGCHGATPSSAPMPLMTYDDLAAAAKSDPGKKVADVVLARMRDPASPMPPSGNRVADADVASFASWLNAGMQRQECGAAASATGSGSPAGGGAPAATSCGSLDNAAWQAIFTAYVGPGSPGHCANAGCHDAARGGWSAGANPTASSMLNAWISRGLISPTNPSSSLLVSASSPLVWFNPNGSMPADNKAPNAQAAADIKAWLAATPACPPDAGPANPGNVGQPAPCPPGTVSITVSLQGDPSERIESRPSSLLVQGGGTGSACFSSGAKVELRATRDSSWSGAPCGVSDRCEVTAAPMSIQATIVD